MRTEDRVISSDVVEALRGVDVILLGHGSSYQDAAAAPIFRAAERLAPVFASVSVGLVKGQPRIDDAFAHIGERPVVVVPYLMADGYFASKRLPNIVVDALGERDVPLVLTPSVGTTQLMISLGANAAIAFARQSEGEWVALVLGHGTPRDTRSAASTNACANEIRASGAFAGVEVAFIDEPPRVDAWLQTSACERVLVVPYFVGPGPHVATEIPEALGIAPNPPPSTPIQSGDRTFAFMTPVGALDGAHMAVVARAAEALKELSDA